MRGVVDYSPHPTVAILDSQRAGETHKGIPIVGTVADAHGLTSRQQLSSASPRRAVASHPPGASS